MELTHFNNLRETVVQNLVFYVFNVLYTVLQLIYSEFFYWSCLCTVSSTLTFALTCYSHNCARYWVPLCCLPKSWPYQYTRTSWAGMSIWRSHKEPYMQKTLSNSPEITHPQVLFQQDIWIGSAQDFGFGHCPACPCGAHSTGAAAWRHISIEQIFILAQSWHV